MLLSWLFVGWCWWLCQLSPSHHDQSLIKFIYMVLNLVLSTKKGNRMVKHLIILMTMLIFLIMLICSSTRALSAITGNGIATLQLQHICSPCEYSPHLLQEYFKERNDQILDNFTLSMIWSKKLYLPFFGVWLFNCWICLVKTTF